MTGVEEVIALNHQEFTLKKMTAARLMKQLANHSGDITQILEEDDLRVALFNLPYSTYRAQFAQMCRQRLCVSS
ncbi:MAG: hypothetical protein WBA76_19400 [Phormidesmis sp.]